MICHRHSSNRARYLTPFHSVTSPVTGSLVTRARDKVGPLGGRLRPLPATAGLVKWMSSKNGDFIQCEAPKIAKLVNITPITMVYGGLWYL